MGTVGTKQCWEKTKAVGFPATAGKMTESADLVSHAWSNFTPWLSRRHISNCWAFLLQLTFHFLFGYENREFHYPGKKWCTGDRSSKAVTRAKYKSKNWDTECKISPEYCTYWISLYYSLLNILLSLNHLAKINILR